ncbi:hypothetical protein NSB04_03400 [Blautia pseudococcoides]|nr:hypothetical protein [Blautia pseudococcoides]
MRICKECVTPDTFPGIVINENGICNRCEAAKQLSLDDKKIESSDINDINLLLHKFKNHSGKYDVVVPLSGGVDSCFALIELVKRYNLKVLAFHNDHGYEPEVATNNVRNLCKTLNVDLVIEQKDYDFMKTLWKYVNEVDIEGLNCCFVCGNVLYANALALAQRYQVPLIVNGYSKGQVELINNKNVGLSWMGELINKITQSGEIDFIDTFLEKMKPLQSQIIFQQETDADQAISTSKILVMPLYMFKIYKTNKDQLRKICKEVFNWQQPENTYPARTTNCTMNWLNNYFDIKKMGYSNYHEEYSVLIRQGEMTREQALEDLEFNPPEGLLEKLAFDLKMKL